MPRNVSSKSLGVTINNVPDEIDPRDPALRPLLEKLSASGASAGEYADLIAPAPQMGIAETAVRELPQNLGVAARGVAQGLASPVTMFADPITRLINLALPPEAQQLPPSEGLSLLLTKLGVPEAQTKAQEILQAASAGMGGAGAETMVGRALAAAPGAIGGAQGLVGGVGRALASGPAQNLAGGAAGGAAAEVARQQGASPALQMGAGLAGGLIGGGLASKTLDAPPVGPVAEAEAAGVRLMTSDVVPPKTFASKWLRSMGEKIPVAGTGPVRQAQQAERVAAVRDLVRQYGAEDLNAATDDVVRDLFAKRADDLGRLTKMKGEVIEKLSEARNPNAILGNIEDTVNIKKIAEGSEPVPDDFYLHGRSSGKEFGNNSFPTMFSRSRDVADGYANEDGSVWMARPSKKAKKIDMYQGSKDMENLIKAVSENYEAGGDQTSHIRNYLENNIDMNDTDAVKQGIRDYIENNFAPENIVSSAQAYDDPDDLNLLGLLPGGFPDWINTPDGAVMMPGSIRAIDAVNLTDAVKPSVVPMPATVAKIDESIARLQGLKTAQVKPVISVLEDWKQAIEGQNLANIEELRKQVGEVFKAPELASVRSVGDKTLSGIYDAVRDDMTAYIKANGAPADLNKWQIANKELTKLMGELDLRGMKTVLERGDITPEEVNKLLFSARRSDVQALYRNLSDAGKAAARSAVLARAAEKAGEELSPDRFATAVKKMGDQVGVFFSGDDLKQVQGLVRVLDYTKRAADAKVLPRTGEQLALPTTAIALGQGFARIFGPGLESFAGTAASLAALGGAARLYESKAVRNLLMQLPQLKPGSPEEAALLKRLLTAAYVVQRQESPKATPAGAPARKE